MQTTVGDQLDLIYLQHEPYVFVQNEQERNAIVAGLGSSLIKPALLCEGDFVTGVIVWIDQADYREVWVTTDAAPYLHDATYRRIV